MKRLKLALCVLFVFACFIPAFSQSGAYELQRAKEYMNSGSYSTAIRSFVEVSRNIYNDRLIRREAKYFIGYCYVKMGDPWSAIDSYKSFLANYDNGNSRFIPDALHVLGRTYENVNDIYSARRYYNNCIDRFPSSQFARKSRDRLNLINGSIPDYGDDYANQNSVTYEIKDLIALARSASTYSDKDRILRSGARRARTAADLIALCKEFANSDRQKEFCDEIVNTSVFRSMRVSYIVKLSSATDYYSTSDMILAKGARNVTIGTDYIVLTKKMSNSDRQAEVFKYIGTSRAFLSMRISDIVKLARSSSTYRAQDHLLIAAAREVARTSGDFKELSNAASNYDTENKIMDIYLGNSNYSDYYRFSVFVDDEITNEMKTEDDKETTAKSSETFASDPFENLSVNKDKVERISKFIKAVDEKKDMDKALKDLDKSDLSLPTVKTYMETYRSIQKFNELHK